LGDKIHFEEIENEKIKELKTRKEKNKGGASALLVLLAVPGIGIK
jgi:hypothetical protein